MSTTAYSSVITPMMIHSMLYVTDEGMTAPQLALPKPLPRYPRDPARERAGAQANLAGDEMSAGTRHGSAMPYGLHVFRLPGGVGYS